MIVDWNKDRSSDNGNVDADSSEWVSDDDSNDDDSDDDDSNDDVNDGIEYNDNNDD